MAINLKKTNVVIIGAGAAGGVAALPLAQAGSEVIALEAGGWVGPRDMAPDELRYMRGWPAKLQKVNDEIPTHRATASLATTPRPDRPAFVSGTGGNHKPAVSGAAGVRLSRLLRPWWLPRQFEEFDRRLNNP